MVLRELFCYCEARIIWFEDVSFAPYLRLRRMHSHPRYFVTHALAQLMHSHPRYFVTLELVRGPPLSASTHGVRSLAPVAQWIERLVPVQKAAGSIPAGCTKESEACLQLARKGKKCLNTPPVYANSCKHTSPSLILTCETYHRSAFRGIRTHRQR